MRILKCHPCGYERSSEEDGRIFHDDDLIPGKLVCDPCMKREKHVAEILATGETTVGPFKISYNN